MIVFYHFLTSQLTCRDAEVEDLQAQKKELESVVQPIVGKLYEGQGGAPPPEEGAGGDDKDEL